MCSCICAHIICSCLLSATLQPRAQLTGQEVAGESRSCVELNSSVLVLHNNVLLHNTFCSLFVNIDLAQGCSWIVRIEFFCSRPNGWQNHSNCSERNKMRNGNYLPFEGLKGNDHMGRGSPNPSIVDAPHHHAHTHSALKLTLSNEQHKVLLLSMLFEGLSSKLTHGDCQDSFSPIRSPPLLWNDVLNLQTDDSWQLSGWLRCYSELCGGFLIIFFVSVSPFWGLSLSSVSETGLLYTVQLCLVRDVTQPLVTPCNSIRSQCNK